MLEIVALSDSVQVLCAKKFLFASQGGCTPNYPLFIYYYYFIIIGLSALAEGPMNSRSCVRARRDIWRSAHQIFLKFGTKLHLGETKKNVPSGFTPKNTPF